MTSPNTTSQEALPASTSSEFNEDIEIYKGDNVMNFDLLQALNAHHDLLVIDLETLEEEEGLRLLNRDNLLAWADMAKDTNADTEDRIIEWVNDIAGPAIDLSFNDCGDLCWK
jgi:hypothetical protein